MIGVRIICVGKLKENFFTDAANEYIKRLAGYCKLEIAEIPEHRLPPGGADGGKFTIHNSQFTIDGDGGRCRNAQSSSAKGMDPHVAIALGKERDAINKKIPAGAVTVALCVDGRGMDSQGLSRFIMDCAGRGASRLCFIIGGSFGLHEEVANGADLKLSMSKMTFPHHLARIMLLEQLYRSFKIAEGGKYHK